MARAAATASVATLLMLLAGCADTIVLRPWATYGVNEVAPRPEARYRLPRPVRFHLPTRHGLMEAYYWDARSLTPHPDFKAPRTASQPATSKRPQLPKRGQPGGPAMFVLMSPGNATLAQELAVWVDVLYAGRDVGVFAWNYPGYGSSRGPRSLRETLATAVEVHDLIRAQIGDRPLILHGVSIGCCVSLRVARERAVDGIVLESPPRIPQIILSPQLSVWNLWLLTLPVALQVPAAYDAYANAGEPKAACPLVVVSGELDPIVPVDNLRGVLQRWPGSAKARAVLPGVRHCPEPVVRRGRAYRAAVRWLLDEVAAACGDRLSRVH